MHLALIVRLSLATAPSSVVCCHERVLTRMNHTWATPRAQNTSLERITTRAGCVRVDVRTRITMCSRRRTTHKLSQQRERPPVPPNTASPSRGSNKLLRLRSYSKIILNTDCLPHSFADDVQISLNARNEKVTVHFLTTTTTATTTVDRGPRKTGSFRPRPSANC